MAEAEDRPITVGGGPHMIKVELPRSSKSDPEPGKFSLEPDDPNVPFNEIVVWDGRTVKLRWKLSQDWKIEIT